MSAGEGSKCGTKTAEAIKNWQNADQVPEKVVRAALKQQKLMITVRMLIKCRGR